MEEHSISNLSSSSIGMHGDMGKVISLFLLYRKTNEKEWESQAEKLLDDIMEKCHTSSPLSYGNGLCGVGVGMEYLFQNHFIEGNADEVLSDIDAIVFDEINTRTLSGLNIDNGILGLAYYFYYRLYYRKESETGIVLALKINVIHLIDWIEEAMRDTYLKSQYYEIFFIFSLLHQLNIFNAKVEKLQNAVVDKLTLELNYESY